MTLTTRRLGVVTGVAALLLALLWYALLFHPQSSHLKAAHRSYNAAQQQVQQLQTQVAGLQALEARIPADKALLATYEADVPKAPDLKDLLDQLHDLATGTGCELTTVSPNTSTSASGGASAPSPGGLTSISMGMTATGTYSQLMAFVSGLATMPRTIVVDNTTISPAQSGGLSITFTAQAFYAP